MKILLGTALHGGEWEAFRAQALEELRTRGAIRTTVPRFHSLDSLWEETLAEMGHEVASFNYRLGFLLDPEIRVRVRGLKEAEDRILPRLAWLRRWDRRRMNEELLALARREKPDVFLTFLCEHVAPESLAALRRLGVRTVLWHERNFFFEMSPGVVEALPHYDVVFTHDPGFLPPLRAAGARRAHYLPLACHPAVHRRLDATDRDGERYCSALSFCGTLTPGRLRFLRELLDEGVAFWTHGWDRAYARCYPELAPRYRGEARGPAMVLVLNGADILLNPHHRTNSVSGTNMRTFEAAACGTFQIAENREEIRRLFDVGREIEVYDAIGDLREKIRHYRDRPREREEMALRAQKKVYERHTYRHRFEEMFAMLEGEN